MASILAAATRCSPSSPKRETARGWSWLFQYSEFQPTSASPSCQRPNVSFRSTSRSGWMSHFDVGPWSSCTCSNWKTMSISLARRVGEELRLLDRHARHLAHGQQAGATGEDLAMHLLQELVEPRAMRVQRERVAVRQAGRLGDQVDDVHPEAVDPPVQPPAHHLVDRRANVRVLPVEIRLLAREEVQVVLAGRVVELPRRAGEERAPIVRRRRAPPVPVALGRVDRGPRLDEPRVLVGRVVDDEVHDQLHAARVDAREQFVELLERPEDRLDVLVVADVVAGVVLRRRVDGREPQHVHPELREVVQVRGDAAQIPDPVAIRSRRTTRG